MESLSRIVLARPRTVIAGLVVLMVAAAVAVLHLIPRVSESNDYPGLAAYEANHRIDRAVGTGGYERPLVPVVVLPAGTTVDSPGVRRRLTTGFERAAESAHGRVVGLPTEGTVTSADETPFTGDSGRTVYALVYPPRTPVGGLPGSAIGEGPRVAEQMTEAIRQAAPPGSRVTVTGLDALATGTDAGGLNVPVKLGATVALALLVLLWLFRSWLAVTPLLMALVAVPLSFLGLALLSPVMTVHETTLIMLPLFGVGIAVDCALILVSRWREETARGGEPAEAVHRAMATSGRAVLSSSAAVALGLVTMTVLPIPLLRSLGVGGMLVTASSAAVTLVLLPLVLLRYGSSRFARAGRTEAGLAMERRENAAWTRLAAAVVRRRRLVALVSLAGLLALCAVATQINLNVPHTDRMADSGPGRQGLRALQQDAVPAGVLTSFDVFVPDAQQPAAVAGRIGDLPGAHGVVAGTGPAWQGAGGSVLTVMPVDEGGTPEGRATVDAVLSAVPDGVLVGGNVTQQMEYLTATYAAFPWMLALVALVTFVVLARAFRSVLLPLKAIALNLISLGAVLGAMVVLWQWGWGTHALFGIRPDGSVGTFVPVTIFAFLYGLSMDYEVFILSRVREEYDRTGSTAAAVVQGVGHTGRLVTAAALILFFSFASMAMGGELDVSVFASGLAFGILIDATVVRGLLVPATVAMMGRWNWWLPVPLARVLRVPAAPLPAADSAPRG